MSTAAATVSDADEAPPVPAPVTISKAAAANAEEADRNTNESAEEHVRRVSVSEKSEETQAQQSKHGDLTPSELLSYLGNAVKKQATTKNATKTVKGVATGKINAQTLESSGEKKAEQFTAAFLSALVPTPTVMGDFLSVEYAAESLKRHKGNGGEAMSLGEAAQATVSLHRETRGHVFQHRVSATARRCTAPGCETYHLRPADVCFAHDELQQSLYRQLLAKMKVAPPAPPAAAAAAAEPPTAPPAPASTPASPASPAPSDAFPGVDDADNVAPAAPAAAASEAKSPSKPTTKPPTPTLKTPTLKTPTQLLQEQVALRHEMVVRAETFALPASFVAQYAPLATQLLASCANPIAPEVAADATQLVQLYHQFAHVLDGDRDGCLTPADVLNHLRSVDVDFLVAQQTKRPAEVLAMAERWLAASHPTQKTRWSFADYVIAVCHHRDVERSYHARHRDAAAGDAAMFSGMAELLRTAFWDLRLILLLKPTNHPLAKFAAADAAPSGSAWQGHLLKRGYFFANERLNAFRHRFFKVVGSELVYYKEIVVPPPKAAAAAKPKATDGAKGDAKGETAATDATTDAAAEDGASDGAATSTAAAPAAAAEALDDVAIDDAAAATSSATGAAAGETGDATMTTTDATTTTPDATVTGAGGATLRRVVKGTIPLQEIASVDFSPKTLLKFNRSLPFANADAFAAARYAVFKVTLYSGRRFTLAAQLPPTDASAAAAPGGELNVFDWTGYLYWWAEVSRRIVSWRLQWGSGRQHRVTLRDWVNAGAVVAKIALIKEKRDKMSTTGALIASAKFLYDKNSTCHRLLSPSLCLCVCVSVSRSRGVSCGLCRGVSPL